MPIYEYQCGRCRRTSSFLIRSRSAHPAPACPHCGARSMRKLVSRFAAGKGRSDTPLDAGESDGDSLSPEMSGQDPQAMARMMRNLAEESGAPPNPEMGEIIRRLEHGEDPEEIEKRMEDAGDGRTGTDGDPLCDG